ncbi:MAG: 4Fe-4S binding protein [bacterium]
MTSQGSDPAKTGRAVACQWKCGVCGAVCGEDALREDPSGFTIDRSRCSKCMACVESCPAGLVPAGLVGGDRVG